jgi:hypothetical protein
MSARGLGGDREEMRTPSGVYCPYCLPFSKFTSSLPSFLLALLFIICKFLWMTTRPSSSSLRVALFVAIPRRVLVQLISRQSSRGVGCFLATWVPTLLLRERLCGYSRSRVRLPFAWRIFVVFSFVFIASFIFRFIPGRRTPFFCFAESPGGTGYCLNAV